MKAKIEIPKGYRRLRVGEATRVGDYALWTDYGLEWFVLTRDDTWLVGTVVNKNGSIFIRKIKKEKSK